jgi:hypothetical protein
MAELTQQQQTIGRLPWVEVSRGGSSYLRIDMAILGDYIGDVEWELSGNRISSARVMSESDGKQYLQVALDDESGKRLDDLRIKSTSWSHTLSPEHPSGAAYTATPGKLQNQQFLDFTIEATGGSPRYYNESNVIKSLAKAYQRQGLNLMAAPDSEGRWSLMVPESEVSKLRVLQGQATLMDKVKTVYTEPMHPTIKTAAVGAGFGVIAAAPTVYQTYQDVDEQMKQGNPIGAGTTVLNSAAEFVAGGVCGAGVAVAAAPVLTVPVAGEIIYGGAVLGAGYACSEGMRNFLETSEHFINQVRQNALNNGLDPDAALTNAQHLSAQVPEQMQLADQGQLSPNGP